MDPAAPRTEFTPTEFAYAVWLVSTLDPERFAKPEAKALITKAKTCADAGHMPVPTVRRTVTHTVRRRWFEFGF